MTTTWNEAFDVLERELQTLSALATAYDDFVRELHERAARRLRPELAGRWDVGVGSDDESIPGQWVLNIETCGAMADAGLEVMTWAAAPYGGPPGLLRVAVYLSENLSEGLPPLEEVLDALRAEGFTPQMGADTDILDYEEAIPLGSSSIRIDEPDVEARLVDLTLRAVARAERAAEVVLGTRERTPYTFLLDILADLERDGTLQATGAIVAPRSSWAGGQHLLVKTETGRKMWVTAVPPGLLVCHWGTQKDASPELLERMRAALDGKLDVRKGYKGLVLLDAERVSALCDKNDAAVVAARVLEAWEAFRSAS